MKTLVCAVTVVLLAKCSTILHYRGCYIKMKKMRRILVHSALPIIARAKHWLVFHRFEQAVHLPHKGPLNNPFETIFNNELLAWCNQDSKETIIMQSGDGDHGLHMSYRGAGQHTPHGTPLDTKRETQLDSRRTPAVKTGGRAENKFITPFRS